jgi:DNA replication protein DnaC
MSNNDPFDPTMRPISPDDLPPAPQSIASVGRADRISKIPAGASDLSRKPRPESYPSCPGCGGVGWYLLAVPYLHPQFGKLQPCDCAAYATQRAPSARRLGDELCSLASKTFASFDLNRPMSATHWQGAPMSVAAQSQFMAAAHRRCEAWADDPRGWLFLHGAFGAGKSHLAAAIANEQQRAGAVVRFVTVNKLLDTLTAALRDHTSDSLIADLIACDLLILDELAGAHLAECASDWRFGRIERLINERLERPTVITSNLAPDDLAVPGDLRAERLADRIAGVSQIVWMPIASYRRIGLVAS